MGAARVLEWTQPTEALVERRPSWLAPAPAKASEPRPRLSVVPGARLGSIAPPPGSVAPVSITEAALPANDVVEQYEATSHAMNAELETLRTTAAELAATLATARRRTLEASEGELVKLALVIAERVVGAAIGADSSLIVGWAREAIATLPARDTLVVAISTDLAASVPEAAWMTATGDTHRLEVDPSLAAGTCEIRAGVASIEVSAVARIAAVGEAIGAIS